MARVNLLPWREELRAQKRTEYFTAVGIFGAIALMLWGLVHIHFNERIDYQKSRNTYLQTEIDNLDSKIERIKELEREKEQLLARMKAIETLQTSRPIIVHIFDELVTSLPDGVYLREVSQTGKKIEIKGVAQSNARVSSFMRNIEASEWLSNPSLEIIETKTSDGRRTANFTLKIEQVQILKRGEDEGDEI